MEEKPPPRAGSTLAILTREVSRPPSTIVQAEVERCQRVPAASLHNAKPRSPRPCAIERGVSSSSGALRHRLAMRNGSWASLARTS